MSPVTIARAIAEDGRFAAVAASQPVVRVSPETTRLVGPLDENGDVDFFKAIEERRSEGVTAEKNAIVPLVKALGSKAAGLTLPKSFFEKLGIAPPETGPSAKGKSEATYDGFSLWNETVNADPQQESLMLQCNFATDHPWTPKLLPELGRWVDSQSAALEKIRIGLLKEKAYIPMVSIKDEYPKLLRARMPLLAEMNVLHRNLAIAAMRELGQKNIDKSIDWVEAIYQLSDHTYQKHASSTESLYARRFRRSGHEALARILRSQQASAENLARIDQLLQRHPPLPFQADDYDTYERWMAIDTVVAMGRGKFEFKTGQDNLDMSPLLLADCDFKATINLLNARMDELVKASKTEGEWTRRSKLWDLRDVARERSAKAVNSAAISVVSKDPHVRGEFLGEMLWGSLAPPACICSQYHTRKTALYRLAQIETALAKFWLANKAYPKTLGELQPKFIRAVPEDPFSFEDKNFYYDSDGETYGLYTNGSFQIKLDQKLIKEWEADPSLSTWQHSLMRRQPATWSEAQAEK